MSFEYYKKMLNAYKNKDNRLFESFAINWIESVESDPFTNEDVHTLFFSAKKYCRIWRKGGIDSRSAKRNMLRCIQKIAEIDLPYSLDLIEEEKEKKEDQEYKNKLEEKVEEETKAINKSDEEPISEDVCTKDEDIRYVLLAMSNAYNEGNDVNFKQFTIHLMETALENPFTAETPEFFKFEEMKEAYIKHNIRKVHVKATELCEIINNTEIYPEKIDIPNVAKETPEEEKKSWVKFLNPWR